MSRSNGYPILLEVCVDDLAGLEAAVAGGADRIELCSALALGGLTPSAGLMAIAATFDIPCNAMIRPRAGDFVFSDEEIDIMLADIEAARNAGLAGVVLGASLSDGRLDRMVLDVLVKAAKGLDLTLHRAFDLVPKIPDAVETAVKLGFSRILTSGAAKTAIEGVDGLKQAIDGAAGRISIMPGSGVSADNAAQFLDLGVSEIHASCSSPVPAVQSRMVEFGFVPEIARHTDVDKVRALKQVIALKKKGPDRLLHGPGRHRSNGAGKSMRLGHDDRDHQVAPIAFIVMPCRADQLDRDSRIDRLHHGVVQAMQVVGDHADRRLLFGTHCSGLLFGAFLDAGLDTHGISPLVIWGSCRSWSGICLFRRRAELIVLGGFLHRRRRGLAARDRHRHCIEIAGANFALVLGRSVPVDLGREFRLL
jgi:copper homeostasis protein